MDAIEKKLLEEVADLHGIPEGAYNIRADGKLAGRNTTAHINIVTKEDKPGIDIYIAPGTKNESVHIPVIISQTGLKDMVYNDFYVGEDCDVTIVAGCGIHNCGTQESRHDGIHSFFVGKNAKVRYIEKHYGEGDGNGENVMNPTTIVDLGENAYMEMETTQIKGIDSTYRDTQAHLSDGATLIIKEKIMTHGHQHAETNFSVDLDGYDSSTNVISRSVAKDHSSQMFNSNIRGNNKCAGHSECDAIITSGGVSVGQKDYLPAVLEQLNADILFAGVAQKPGSPMLAGKVGGKLVFCLSGNPFAAAATLEQYAVPALLRAAGRCEESCLLPRTTRTLTTGFSKPSKGNRYLRAKAMGGSVTIPGEGNAEAHSSGSLSAMIGCNCLVELPAGSGPVTPGEEVEVLSFVQ